MKFPLEPGSEAAINFQTRLEAIALPGLPRLPITDHGIDHRGIGFISILHRDTQPLSLQRIADPTSLFVNVIETVSKFHERGIFLGDICGVSFVVDGVGRVLLSAMLGSFEYSASGTSLIPPRETLFYIAPEQRIVASPTATCDIYALGIMGYKLITGRFPQGNKPERFLDQNIVEQALAPSELVANCPEWVDRVIARCIDTDVSKRFQSCLALLDDLKQGECSSDGTTDRWLRRNKTVHFNLTGLSLPSLSSSVEKGFSFFRSRLLFGLVGAVVVVLVAYGSLRPQTNDTAAMIENQLEGITEGESLEERRTRIIKQVVTTGDPLAVYVLGSLILQQQNSSLRKESEDALTGFYQRRNLPYIASAMSWVLDLPESRYPGKEQMRQILESFDERYQGSFRLEKLRLLHARDKTLAAVILTALVLSKQIDGVSVLQKQWFQEIGAEGAAIFYTPVALTLSSSTMREVFGSHLRNLVAELHPEETIRLLEMQSGEDLELVMHLSARAKSEHLYPPFQELIVAQIMVAAGAGQSDLAGVLIRGLSNQISRSDIALIGPCEEQSEVTALLSLFLLSNDRDVTGTILGKLGQCLLPDALSRDLLAGQFQSYSPLLRARVIISLATQTGYSELDQALSVIIPSPSRDVILKGIFEHGEPELIGLTLERIGGALSSQYLLSLAKHPNSDVRSRVISMLVRRDDPSIEAQLADLITNPESDR
jgi:serine/threonine protein kinase